MWILKVWATDADKMLEITNTSSSQEFQEKKEEDIA